MAIILDAEVIIAGEKGTLDLEKWFSLHASEEIEIAAITIAELWHGVERAVGKLRERRQAYLEEIVSPLPIIAYTESIAYQHARIWARLEAAGRMIGYYDVDPCRHRDRTQRPDRNL